MTEARPVTDELLVQLVRHPRGGMTMYWRPKGAHGWRHVNTRLVSAQFSRVAEDVLFAVARHVDLAPWLRVYWLPALSGAHELDVREDEMAARLRARSHWDIEPDDRAPNMWRVGRPRRH